MSAKEILKSLGVVSIVAGAAMAAQAIPLSVDPNLPPTTTAYVLGAMDPDLPASDADDVILINAILGLSLGGSGPVVIGPKTDEIYRSQNVFSGLPSAGSVTTTGSVDGTSTSIVLSSGFDFLVAKYGTEAEVWYIGGLSGTLTIPANAFGAGLSGTSLYDNTGSQSTVPDGGSTVVLLGLASLGLFGYARKVQAA